MEGPTEEELEVAFRHYHGIASNLIDELNAHKEAMEKEGVQSRTAIATLVSAVMAVASTTAQQSGFDEGDALLSLEGAFIHLEKDEEGRSAEYTRAGLVQRAIDVLEEVKRKEQGH